MAIFPVYYFPPISWFAALLKENEIIFEGKQHYQKQEYLSRARICTSNRVLPLIIPVGRGKTHIPLENSRISDHQEWQKLHWRSIESAYRSSPFFEYYEPKILPLFESNPEFLFQHNIACIEKILEILRREITWSFAPAFEKSGYYEKDYRFSFDPTGKKIPAFFRPEPYTQVFGEFSPDLSILDLLFNLGPESEDYLIRNFIE